MKSHVCDLSHIYITKVYGVTHCQINNMIISYGKCNFGRNPNL